MRLLFGLRNLSTVYVNLGAMHGPTAVEVLKNAISEYSDREFLAWLDELDTLGFIQTDRAAAAYYLEAA
jgi:hypothetical protein